MRGFKKSIALSICSVLLSVSAVAMPIDTTHFDVMLPVTITDIGEVPEVTTTDFTLAMLYVVDLAVATPVPIEDASRLIAQHFDLSVANFAVMKNSNFERHL